MGSTIEPPSSPANWLSLLITENPENDLCYTAFTHAGLTITNRTENLYKSIFVLSKSRDILFVKKLENLLHTASIKFEF